MMGCTQYVPSLFRMSIILIMTGHGGHEDPMLSPFASPVSVVDMLFEKKCFRKAIKWRSEIKRKKHARREPLANTGN